MSRVQEQAMGQQRWNQIGKDRIKKIENNPDRYIISECPFSHRESYNELLRLLSPIQGKKILELGCGTGDFSIWLAKQGARVTAVDIGPDLVAAARILAEVNQVDCEFRQGNIMDLPFESATYDIGIGLATLHHLSEAEVLKVLRECCRVLKTGGTAVFEEPVENSKLFNFIQNVFPKIKGGSDYRPSILQRKAWTKYIETLDDRNMTNREFVLGGKKFFRVVRISPYGFLIRLTGLTGKNHRNTLLTLDRFLFSVFPLLRYYSQTVLVEYQK